MVGPVMPQTSAKNTGLSPASTDLGLGDMLQQQTEDETDEERRRRLANMQRQQSGIAAGPQTAATSLSAQMLFGGAVAGR